MSVEQQQQQLPFKQGDRVIFSTPNYRGWGVVVGMAPGNGFCNLAVVIEHRQLELLKPHLASPFTAGFSTVVVDLYNPIDLVYGITDLTERYVTLIQ